MSHSTKQTGQDHSPGNPPSSPLALERFMRKFYKRFKLERTVLLASIEGGSGEEQRSRFASLCLSRLIFLYFLQGQGWLDTGEPDASSPIRDLLPILFHQKHETQTRSPGFASLLDRLPYLNSALFNIHDPENPSAGPSIPMASLERLCTFFDGFSWCLSDHPIPPSQALTPEILAAVFEQSGDQKQMGAYYTQQDISIYISKSVLIPCFFDTVEQKCPDAFIHCWSLLAKNPDTYIYASVRQGCHLPLHPEIAAGLFDEGQRAGWNAPADTAYGLPEETWREVIARRQRYEQTRAKMRSGEITSIDALVTWNLDLQQFSRDVILTCERLDLLQIFYESLESLTVLDPTCGTGAFLLSALSVLEELYEVCLGRIQVLVARHRHAGKTARNTPGTIQHTLIHLNQILQTSTRYPNRAFFIRASIIARNLYGVDIMPEAVEICKLRLTLTLLSQAKDAIPVQMYLPLHFNIRAGNTLVGQIDVRESQPEATPGAHSFHWSIEFQEAMQHGGFAAIIGNPPYVAYGKVKQLYQVAKYHTQSCDNLYAYTVERALELLCSGGRCGLVGPVSTIASSRYHPLCQLLLQKPLWVSSYSNRPDKLFPDVEQRLAIMLLKNTAPPVLFASSYQHWYKPERPHLFDTLAYVAASTWLPGGTPLKSGSSRAEKIFASMSKNRPCWLLQTRGSSDSAVWVHNGPTYWVRALAFQPDEEASNLHSHHYRKLAVSCQSDAFILSAILSSSTFYFFYKLISNCRDLGQKELRYFPLDPLQPALTERLEHLGKLLMESLKTTSRACTRHYPAGTVVYREYYPALAKSLLDKIDQVLAEHYGFTADELDFIINYEIKYRVADKT